MTLTKIIFEVHAGYFPAMGLEEIKIVRVRQRKYNFSKCWLPCVQRVGRNARAELRGHQATDPCCTDHHPQWQVFHAVTFTN